MSEQFEKSEISNTVLSSIDSVDTVLRNFLQFKGLIDFKDSNLRKKSFTNLNQICKGGNSILYQGINKLDQQLYALKKIYLSQNSSMLELWEPFLLKIANHPRIVKMQDFFIQISKNSGNEYLYIEMPFYAQNLSQFIQSRNQNLSESTPKNNEMALDIIDALDYLHNTLGFIHRDLKSANILLDADYNAILADFGLARPLQMSLTDDDLDCYTNMYASPEQKKGEKLDFSCDIYALGIILIEIMYPVATNMEFMGILKKCQLKQLDLLQQYERQDILRVISKCLDSCQECRPNLNEIRTVLQTKE